MSNTVNIKEIKNSKIINQKNSIVTDIKLKLNKNLNT
jgi:hypothetical protein